MIILVVNLYYVSFITSNKERFSLLVPPEISKNMNNNNADNISLQDVDVNKL